MRRETCAICTREIEPAARFFTKSGEPRHMLCEESPEVRARPRPDFDPRIDYPERYTDGRPV